MPGRVSGFGLARQRRYRYQLRNLVRRRVVKIRFYAGGLLLLTALGLADCSTVESPQQHVVLVDHEGRSLYLAGPKARKIESTNDFEQHLTDITKAITTCTNCLAPDGTRQILIFVHGGLNTYNQSLARANEITPAIATNHYYPLFVNWDSGLKSSYFEHLFLVRQGEVERVWGPVTFPLYFVADVGRAVTRAPIVWYYQLTSDFTTMVRYESPIQFGHSNSNWLARASTGARSGLYLSIGSDQRMWLNQCGYFSSYVVTFPFKLATGPVIDAFGKSAWDNMSRRTQTMFRSPGEFARPAMTNEIRPARHRVGEPARGAVARLMQALDDLAAANPSNHYAITLIGHSMGTIVANEMVLTHPNLCYSNIIYMGAACDVSDFANAVIPCLERNTNAHFYNLTLHPIAEAREAQWTWLDLTPRGSLLEWIDNFLSTPRTVPERTLGKWDNAISTTALIPTNVASRVRIKAFAVGPRDKFPDNPMVHGDFSEEPFWETNFWIRRAP
jgi:pimeloyl-ACP methyl ester carboxylesterase